MSDYGVSFLANVLSMHSNSSRILKIKNLTLYNNNIGDLGAECLADSLEGSPYIETINLQMNFIKDIGVSYFVDAVRRGAYESLRKIVLNENQCTERLKRFIRNNTPIIMV